MSRQLKVRVPSVVEIRQLRQILETSTNARLCGWAEVLLFFAVGLNAQSIADALAVHVNTLYACMGLPTWEGYFSSRLSVPAHPRVSRQQRSRKLHVSRNNPRQNSGYRMGVGRLPTCATI